MPKKSKSEIQPPSSLATGEQRINKVLAAAGIGSRREVEDLIVQGRVEIDSEIVKNLARKVDPQQAKIKVDGTLLKLERPVYFALNKPPGVLSTNQDPSGRMRVIDLVPHTARVFSVGRLDRSSEGLILLTNDGGLAQRLAHPRFRIQKSYHVVVAGLMTKEELAVLHKGVHLAEGFARIDGAIIRKHRKGCTELEIVLSEGKNREIRRMLARAGHKVVVLRRISIGPLRLGQLPVGASRELSPTEVKALYAATDPKNRAKKKPGKSAAKPNANTTKPNANPAQPKGSKPPPPDPMLEDLDEDDMPLPFDLMNDEDFGAHDDDFVGDFSDSPRTGSVIAFDDERPSEKPPRRNSSKSQAQPRPTRKGASGSRKTQAGGTMAPRPRGAGASRGTAGSRGKTAGAAPKRSGKRGSTTSGSKAGSQGRDATTPGRGGPKGRGGPPKSRGAAPKGKGHGAAPKGRKPPGRGGPKGRGKGK